MGEDAENVGPNPYPPAAQDVATSSGTGAKRKKTGPMVTDERRSQAQQILLNCERELKALVSEEMMYNWNAIVPNVTPVKSSDNAKFSPS